MKPLRYLQQVALIPWHFVLRHLTLRFIALPPKRKKSAVYVLYSKMHQTHI